MIGGLQSRYLNERDLLSLGIRFVGTNVLVSEHATIVGLENIQIGSNVRIDSHVVILSKRGLTTIGNNVHIEPASSIVAHRGVSLGNYVTLSHGVRLYTESADYSGASFTNVFPDGRFLNPKGGPIRIGDHVIIGGNSVVMPNVTVGEGAAVGALSFVRESIDGWAIYAGNPLRRLSDRSREICEIARRIESGEL